ALALGFGVGVGALVDAVPAGARAARWIGVAVAVLPVALAPSLAFAAWGRLHTAGYPGSWDRAESAMSADPSRGAVLVLPWHAYLPFSWNRDQTVRQPAPQFFSRHAVVATDLELGAVTLPGEDPWSRLAGRAIDAGGPLAPQLPGLGVRYVLLFHEADWRTALPVTK